MRERERERFKVTFLLDKSNIWIKKHLLKYDFNIKNKYIFKITNDHNLIKNQDIVFPLSYTKILSEDFLNKNKLTLIAHASKLPKDKGFAPVQYQILKNHKKIYISLIKAAKEVDAGDIYLRDFFILKGYELSDEIRYLQAKAVFEIIKKFLIKYPNVKSKPQKGRSNFNLRRRSEDSEININKSIKSQFNLLRICDNELYPAFFKYKKNKYILKIYHNKEE